MTKVFGSDPTQVPVQIKDNKNVQVYDIFFYPTEIWEQVIYCESDTDLANK